MPAVMEKPEAGAAVQAAAQRVFGQVEAGHDQLGTVHRATLRTPAFRLVTVM